MFADKKKGSTFNLEFEKALSSPDKKQNRHIVIVLELLLVIDGLTLMADIRMIILEWVR